MRAMLIARYLDARDLVESLRGAGVHVVTVTETPDGAGGEAAEYPPIIPGDDGLARLLQFNVAAYERGAAILLESGADVVHAHGWDVAHAAVALRRAFGLPLVAVPLAALAAPRDPIERQMRIWLGDESDAVVVGAPGERTALRREDGIPASKVHVVGGAGEPGGRVRAVYESALARVAAAGVPAARTRRT